MAMVTVLNKTAENDVFQVKLFNKALRQLLPDEVITFSTAEEQLPVSNNSPALDSLFHLLRQAICQHLYEQPMTANGNVIKEDKHDPNTKP